MSSKYFFVLALVAPHWQLCVLAHFLGTTPIHFHHFLSSIFIPLLVADWLVLLTNGQSQSLHLQTHCKILKWWSCYSSWLRRWPMYWKLNCRCLGLSLPQTISCLPFPFTLSVLSYQLSAMSCPVKTVDSTSENAVQDLFVINKEPHRWCYLLFFLLHRIQNDKMYSGSCKTEKKHTRVAWWSALLPQSKKVQSLNQGLSSQDLSAWRLHVLHVSVWDLSGYSPTV